MLAALILIGWGGTLPAQNKNCKGLNTWLLRSYLANAKYVQDLGVGIVRIELPWELVEPNRNQFDWTRTDEMIEAARANHVEVLFTLRSISSWGMKLPAHRDDLYHNASSPRAMAEWEQFVGTTASRCQGRGVDYEIENEVNANFWAGSLKECLKLLKASYHLIKANDPGALVLSSAMACGIVFDQKTRLAEERFRQKSDEWFKPIPATKAFDMVSVHDYYFPSEITVDGWTSWTAENYGSVKNPMPGPGP